jgi:hypothetical protein
VCILSCRLSSLNWFQPFPQWEHWCLLAGLEVHGSGFSPAKDSVFFKNRDPNEIST